MMKFIEKMFTAIIKNLFGVLKIQYEDKEINFKTPWERIEYSSLIKKLTKIDAENINKEASIQKSKGLRGSGR